jgi:hypothetical protein
MLIATASKAIFSNTTLFMAELVNRAEIAAHQLD